MKRDGYLTSCWQQVEEFEPAGIADVNSKYDVLIVGGGITGITTALLLQSVGLKCLVSEMHSIGFGTTSGTSAHLNSFLDTPYNSIIENFGETEARMIYRGASAAINLIREHVSEYKISCSFKEMTGFLFTTEEKQNEEMEKIIEGCNKVGMDIGYTNTSPLPVSYYKIASFTGQAQFHPLKYIIGLAKAFEEKGGRILHNNPVTKVEEADIISAHTPAGIIMAKKLVYATHVPPGVNILHFRAAPYRSYVMAVKLKDEKCPEAVAYDMEDPYHYYRSEEIDGKNYLIVGGEDHKTGHEENATAHLRQLESYIRKFFEVDEVVYKWSSQYYESADGLPYIGHFPGHSENVYVATGFGGNGMIYGTLSAIIFRDLIIRNDSEFRKLLSPARVKPVAGFKNFVTEAADVVANLVEGRFSAEKLNSISELAHGEGKAVKYDGHNMGLYKDEQGKLHGVSTDCPHIHCAVKWNNAERSWDCPCHGSRFDIDGGLLTGPSQKQLRKFDLH